MTLAVTLTVEQLRALVRDEVKAAVQELAHQPNPGEPLTDAEIADMRQTIARRVAGRR
jgi:hypothetical protein